MNINEKLPYPWSQFCWIYITYFYSLQKLSIFGAETVSYWFILNMSKYRFRFYGHRSTHHLDTFSMWRFQKDGKTLIGLLSHRLIEGLWGLNLMSFMKRLPAAFTSLPSVWVRLWSCLLASPLPSLCFFDSVPLCNSDLKPLMTLLLLLYWNCKHVLTCWATEVLCFLNVFPLWKGLWSPQIIQSIFWCHLFSEKADSSLL